MSRFSLIDPFLLSGTLFSNAVNCAYVLHDVDNTSNHEPIVLQLDLNVDFVQLVDRVHTPRTSWAKAKDGDLQNYRFYLSKYLHDTSINTLPYEALLCREVTCCIVEHAWAINT